MAAGSSAMHGADEANTLDAAPSDPYQIRAQYREIEARMVANQLDLQSPENRCLAGVVDEINVLHRESRNQGSRDAVRSAVVDSRLALMASEYGYIQSANLKKRTPEAFLDKLRSNMGKVLNDPENVEEHVVTIRWDDLGEVAANAFAQVPCWDNPWHAMMADAPAKARKQREKRAKDSIDPEVHPTALSLDEINREAESTQNLRLTTMVKVLANEDTRLRPRTDDDGAYVKLFHLLVHPTSFSNTIENFFDLCFLVKEGRAGIQMSQSGEPMVRPTESPRDEAYLAGSVKKMQNILSLDYPTYQELAKRYGAGYLLPTRAVAAAAGSRQH
mmetsp:Transcript_20878/g.61781  ORF Transcript_20878/g.61781 Transcript_20878/m.61781 type:complete len:331 (+) Transcript_20878:14-1006(+)